MYIIVYQRIVDTYSQEENSLLAHYDAKWDNWFQTREERKQGTPGSILGDFGNVCAGTEYRDIARALLDKESNFSQVRTAEFVQHHVQIYQRIRSKLEAYSPDNLLRKVQDHLISESLRIAAFQYTFTQEISRAQPLLDVATYYALQGPAGAAH